MSETEAMRYGDTTVSMTHKGRTVETTLDGLEQAAEAAKDRLPGIQPTYKLEVTGVTRLD